MSLTLRPGCGPVPLASAPDPAAAGPARSLWCPSYDLCLDLAFRRRWASWSCDSCPDRTASPGHRAAAAARTFAARRLDHPPDLSGQVLVAR